MFCKDDTNPNFWDPMCNLTREERKFLEKVHIEVEGNDAEEPEKQAYNDAAGKTKSQRYINAQSLIKSCLFSKKYFKSLI